MAGLLKRIEVEPLSNGVQVCAWFAPEVATVDRLTLTPDGDELVETLQYCDQCELFCCANAEEAAARVRVLKLTYWGG